MSFALQTIYGLLKLSPADQKVCDAAMPAVHEVVVELNRDQDNVAAAYKLLVQSAPIVNRFFGDWKTAGPALEDVTGGGNDVFKLLGAMSAFKDIEATISANPKVVNSAQTLWGKFLPLVNIVKKHEATLLPAAQVVVNSMNRGNVTIHAVLRAVEKRSNEKRDQSGD